MRDKRLRLDLLPDGFLIEYGIPDDTGRTQFNDLAKFNVGWVEDEITPFKQKFRPALNHWHFNDGSMVLPDGLVVEFQQRDKEILTGSVINGFILVISHGGNIVDEYELEYSEGVAPMFINGDIIAVKIIGVTSEYAKHGSELGMEVIE